MKIHSLFCCVFILTTTLVGGLANNWFLTNNDTQDTFRCSDLSERSKTIIGHSETIFLGDEKNLVFDAKVDSGAETSSLHALNIVPYSRKVVEKGVAKELMFVRFITIDHQGKKQTLEKMVSRVDQVRSASGTSTRYFFREIVWIDRASYEIEINLADRSGLSKKMLIGKNVLKQGYLIDTNQSYVITRMAAVNDRF